MSIRVFIVDDHRILREGLRELLERQPSIRVIGEAEDGEIALKLVNETLPDVVVMDILMPNHLSLWLACLDNVTGKPCQVSGTRYYAAIHAHSTAIIQPSHASCVTYLSERDQLVF